MPTYLYLCPNHGEFEEYHSISHLIEDCPKCQADNAGAVQKVKRLICGTTKGVVELTGNELVAKTKEDIVKLKRDMHSDTKVYSNLLGEAKYESLQKKLDEGKRNRKNR